MAMEEPRAVGVRKRILAAIDLSQYSLPWDLLLVGVVTLVVVLVSYGSWRRKVANLPPGPRNWPVIGALFDMEPLAHKAFDKFAARYGSIVHFRLGVQALAVVSSVEGAEELLKRRDAEFSDRHAAMSRSVAKYLSFNRRVFPFANYDAELVLLRRLTITEFFTISKMKSYQKLRTQEVAVMVEKIFREIQSSVDAENLDAKSSNGNGNGAAPMGIRSITFAVVRNVVFALCFGKRFDSLVPTDELTAFPALLDELMDLLGLNLVDHFPWLTWLDPQGLLKRMKMLEKRQTKFYEGILEKSRQATKKRRELGQSEGAAEESSRNNFVDVLLGAQEAGTKLIDDGIIGIILSVLSAGIDTTGSQVEWVLLELVRHPKIMQRLQYELDTFVGKERPLEEADLPSMPFLNAVLLETLRLHPSVPYTFPHVNLQPSTLCGYKIPAKTAVIMNIYGIGRDPKEWKDPLQFNPDRFMAGGSSLSTESIKANGNFYNLLPFSSGRRVCPGYNLAIVLLLRMVGSLVHAFDWAPPPGCSAQDLSIEESGAFILHPSPSPSLVPTPRLSSNVYRSGIP